MSAPNTDLEKQKRRHLGPLLGMRAVVLWALVLLVLLSIYVFMRGDEPGESTPVDGTVAPAADGTTPPAAVTPPPPEPTR
jgi:hypothetical protein